MLKVYTIDTIIQSIFLIYGLKDMNYTSSVGAKVVFWKILVVNLTFWDSHQWVDLVMWITVSQKIISVTFLAKIFRNNCRTKAGRCGSMQVLNDSSRVEFSFFSESKGWQNKGFLWGLGWFWDCGRCKQCPNIMVQCDNLVKMIPIKDNKNKIRQLDSEFRFHM